MLSYNTGVPTSFHFTTTALSALVAILFTFFALAYEPLAASVVPWLFPGLVTAKGSGKKERRAAKEAFGSLSAQPSPHANSHDLDSLPVTPSFPLESPLDPASTSHSDKLRTSLKTDRTSRSVFQKWLFAHRRPVNALDLDVEDLEAARADERRGLLMDSPSQPPFDDRTPREGSRSGRRGWRGGRCGQRSEVNSLTHHFRSRYPRYPLLPLRSSVAQFREAQGLLFTDGFLQYSYSAHFYFCSVSHEG